MAKNKYLVFVTYGVYVGADEYDDADIVIKAVNKMFDHGPDAVAGSCDAEIEDITEEFEDE